MSLNTLESNTTHQNKDITQIAPDLSKQDIAKRLHLVAGIECKPEEIAQNQAEINDNTRIYIGPLFQNFFQLIPAHVEHIYSDFPEGKVYLKELTIGGKSAEELEKEMREKGVEITKYASHMMHQKEFTTLEKPESVRLVRLSQKAMGFIEDANPQLLTERMYFLGLDFSPAEVGPQYRLDYMDQPLGERIHIWMRQILSTEDYHGVFEIGHNKNGLWINDGYWKDPEHPWFPGPEFVFRVPEKSQGNDQNP